MRRQTRRFVLSDQVGPTFDRDAPLDSLRGVPVHALALFVAAAVLAVALVVAVLARVRAARRVGVRVAAERGSRSPLLLLPLALALGLVIVGGAEPLPIALVLAAAAFHFIAPRIDDRVLGRDGLQRGWFSLRFEHIESWRLTGDHLRVHLRGEWEAVPAPARDHAELAKVLEERAPGRKSRFTA
jgi:hypothetical protein